MVPRGLALGITAVVAHHVEQPRAIGTTLANRELPLHSAVVRVSNDVREHICAPTAHGCMAGVVLGQATVRMREPHCWMNRGGPERRHGETAVAVVTLGAG